MSMDLVAHLIRQIRGRPGSNWLGCGHLHPNARSRAAERRVPASVRAGLAVFGPRIGWFLGGVYWR
jgi:hypothetical protein